MQSSQHSEGPDESGAGPEIAYNSRPQNKNEFFSELALSESLELPEPTVSQNPVFTSECDVDDISGTTFQNLDKHSPMSCALQNPSNIWGRNILTEATLSTPRNTKRKRGKHPMWKQTEKIFLAGIVMDTYRRNHSLKPIQNVKAKPEVSNGCNKIWEGIHKRYKVALDRHKYLTGEELPKRTVVALQKRWKVEDKTIETEVDDQGCFLIPVPATRNKEMIWERKFNIGQRYTCSHKLFQTRYQAFRRQTISKSLN